MKNFKRLLLDLAHNDEERFASEVMRRMRVTKRSKNVQRLKDFVLVQPELVSQIRAWLDAAKDDRALRNLHGFMMTYLYHPLDFVPEENQGLFGYLDDAYLVGSIYHLAMNHFSAGERRFLPGLEGIADRIRLWLRLTRRVLPREADRIDRMIEDLGRADSDSFYEMMGRDARVFRTFGS